MKKRFPLINIILFLLTLFTTIAAGAFQKGVNPITEPARLVEGLPFSISLMCILLTHEFAHYFASRKHRIRATLPYFIPAPPPIIFGTFGAFIKMKSPILSRKALVDVGASGPVAGFFVALIATIVGLSLSEVVTVKDVPVALYLGDSILFRFLTYLIIGSVPEGKDIFLHPIAFAGWIGFFVTFLNLMPIGQLDGGHITYALIGKKHRNVSLFLIGLLIFFGAFYFHGWLVWALLMIILGVNHPPIFNADMPLDQRRRFLGSFCFLIFILTFIPVPFHIEL